MQISLISSKDSRETRTVHTKSDNIEIMMSSETDEIVKELFKYLLQRYQEGLEEWMRGSEFDGDSVDLLYYHLQIISLKKRWIIYRFSQRIKNKKATINPKTKKDDKRLQYALTVVPSNNIEN